LRRLNALFAAIKQGADIAIGSRWLQSDRQTQRQPLYRQFFGRCFNAVTRFIMRLPYADTQCGFKAFTRQAAQTVFQLQTIERWGFDPEILFIALKRDFWIIEVPVTWAHDERSRMSYLKDGFKMLQEITIVRWNAFRGRYDKPVDAPPRVSKEKIARPPALCRQLRLIGPAPRPHHRRGISILRQNLFPEEIHVFVKRCSLYSFSHSVPSPFWPRTSTASGPPPLNRPEARKPSPLTLKSMAQN